MCKKINLAIPNLPLNKIDKAWFYFGLAANIQVIPYTQKIYLVKSFHSFCVFLILATLIAPNYNVKN